MKKYINQKGFLTVLALIVVTAIIGYFSYKSLIQEGDNPNTEGFKRQLEEAEEIARIAEERVKRIEKEFGENAEEEQDKIDATLKISAREDSYEYSKEVNEGISVFGLMELVSEDEDFDFKYTESGLGVFIEEIQGIENDASENMYWMFYANDKMADVGASEYTLSDGDAIEWKYEDTSDIWQ
jgi:hypothetical protein